MYATESRKKNEFKLTSCSGCVIMLMALLLFGFAFFSKFFEIGTMIKQQYTESTLGFSG